MTQEEFDNSVEIGEIVVTDQGEKLRCVGKDDDGPYWELVR